MKIRQKEKYELIIFFYNLSVIQVKIESLSNQKKKIEEGKVNLIRIR